MNETETVPSAGETPAELPKQPRSRKAFARVAAVAVVLLAAIVLIVLFSGPKYEQIRVVYTGSRDAGVVLDAGNAAICVTGIDKDGSADEIPVGKWTLAEPATLEPDTTSTVIVCYRKLEAELQVKCTTSLVRSISASYEGNAVEGVVIGPENAGFHVVAEFKNGDKRDVTKDCSVEGGSVRLERDKTSTVTAHYSDPYNGEVFSYSISVKCSTRTVTSISAKYSGQTYEGIVLNSNNTGITVTATYRDGSTEKVTGWTVAPPVTLKADESATVTISYEGCTCKLTVPCSTISEAAYKKSCTQVSYDQLSRNYNDWRGERVKISGRIFQIVSEGSGYWQVYTYLVATSGRSNNLIYVVYTGPLDSRLLEGDSVTIYGEADGLYSYTTVLGATRTVPEIDAEYMK